MQSFNRPRRKPCDLTVIPQFSPSRRVDGLAGRRAGDRQRRAAHCKVGTQRMGRRRQGRRAQPHDTGTGAEGRRPRQERQDRNARQGLCVGRAGVRDAQLETPHSRTADRRPFRRPAARLQRRIRGHGAGPDRHAVRRPRPHRRHHVEGHVLLQRPLPARQGDQRERTGSARGRACRAERLRVPRRAARRRGAARRRTSGAEGEQSPAIRAS